MPNLNQLLYDTNADEVERIDVPEGYWKATIKSARLQTEDRDGNPLEDKKGEAYARAVLTVVCAEPFDGVDPTEAATYLEKGGPAECVVSFNKFIRGKNDVASLTELMHELGAPTVGRSIAAVVEDLKTAQLPCIALVETEVYNDEARRVVTVLTALP